MARKRPPFTQVKVVFAITKDAFWPRHAGATYNDWFLSKSAGQVTPVSKHSRKCTKKGWRLPLRLTKSEEASRMLKLHIDASSSLVAPDRERVDNIFIRDAWGISAVL
ncbi:hypothetical protein Tco_0488525 [Tanacetum coccineum]